jgi:chorismate mutase
MFKLRGIRGAIDLKENSRDCILDASRELLSKMLEINQVDIDDIASIFFTATDDLNAEFPAYAARQMGLSKVPLLCAREMHVSSGMKSLIRILIHVNTELTQEQIKHQYLGETVHLRPDLNTRGKDDDSRHEN